MGLSFALCPVCGSDSFTPVYPGTIPAGDLANPSIYYSSSRQKAGYLPIVRCHHCDLLMTNPRDDLATLRQVYSDLQDIVYDAEDDNRRRTAEEHFALVSRYWPRPGRLLDVGCATGTFICVAQRAGWEAMGLDASHWSIEQAQNRCPQAQFRVGLLEDASFSAGNFDVITLWDVLEHVVSPAGTLQLLHQWLAPSGILLLNLPNGNSLIAKLMGRHWVLLLREHLWYFSPPTITRLLKQNGFTPTGIKTNFVHFSLANVFSRLSQYPSLSGRIAGKIHAISALKHLSVRFPMGEMNVIAKKDS